MAAASLRLDLSGARQSVLRTESGVVDLDRLTGIYARALGPAAPSGTAGEVTEALHQWLDVTDVPVMGRPASMFSNGSKPHQARLIAAAGLRVPTTLVTNDPSLVREFLAEQGRVIFKSISGIRSIVRELDDDALARLDRIRALPTQFQGRVPGVDVRVHVVGERVFPTRILSSAADYRYAARDGLACDLEASALSPDVEAACVRVAADLELPLAGVDLRIGEDGAATCFEVNPMPAFSYYESNTGQPIALAIAEWLANGGCAENTEGDPADGSLSERSEVA